MPTAIWEPITAGILVALINKYIINGKFDCSFNSCSNDINNEVVERTPPSDDSITSETTAINSDVSDFSVHHYTH